MVTQEEQEDEGEDEIVTDYRGRPFFAESFEEEDEEDEIEVTKHSGAIPRAFRLSQLSQFVEEFPPPQIPAPPPPQSLEKKQENSQGALPRVRSNAFSDGSEAAHKDRWVIININENYEFSPTYPQYFCVPSSLNFSELQGSLSFRSKGRIPILTWKHKRSDAALLRSSQPLIGVVGNYSTGDEQLLKYVHDLNLNFDKLKIIDARGKNAASANHARGAGYERSRYSDFASVEFMGIENIHAIRDSLNRLFECLKRSDDSNWLTNIDNTYWLKHIRSIMLASSIITNVYSSSLVPSPLSSPFPFLFFLSFLPFP